MSGFIVFEKRINAFNKRKGGYERGIVYGKGSFIYDEIP